MSRGVYGTQLRDFQVYFFKFNSETYSTYFDRLLKTKEGFVVAKISV